MGPQCALCLQIGIGITKLISVFSIVSGGRHIPAVTIRNLSAEAHRALKARAAHHRRSTEAEIRAILEAAVRPTGRLRIGTAISALSRDAGLTNPDTEALEQARDKTPATPMPFE